MSSAKVYDSTNDAVTINFLADQLADVDALLTFVIECARANESYEDFRKALIRDLGEVKITKSINVEEWLKGQNLGFVLVHKERSRAESGSITYSPDYLRDDDGLPIIFASRSEAMEALPKNHEFIRVLDLSERKVNEERKP